MSHSHDPYAFDPRHPDGPHPQDVRPSDRTGRDGHPGDPGYPGYAGYPGDSGAPGHGDAPAYGYGSAPAYGQAPGHVPGTPVPYGRPDASAPYGTDPMTAEPYSERSKLAAGLLQIFLGGFGVGRFYMGTTGIAVAQLVLTLIGLATTVLLIGFVILFGTGVWALVDGIVILVGRPRDGRGRLLRP